MNNKTLLAAMLECQQDPMFSQLYADYQNYMNNKYHTCPKKTDILTWEKFKGERISEAINGKSKQS